MERASILLVAGALVAMVAIGAAAGSLDSAVEHDAGDLFDSPIAPYEAALAEEVHDRTDEGGDSDSFGGFAIGSERETPDGGAAGTAEAIVTQRDGGGFGSTPWRYWIALPLILGLATLALRYRSRLAAVAQRGRSTPSRVGGVPSTAPPVPPSNPITSMWLDFAQAVAVDSLDARTSAEIADVAISAGLDREAVRELTRVFEEVEYGGHPVTPERINRARTAHDRLTAGADLT